MYVFGGGGRWGGGGGTKARICPTPWTDSKWRPVTLKRDGSVILNLIEAYLCGAKNGKKICYRILDFREMGRSPRSDDNMNDSCVKIIYMRKTAITKY